MAKLVLVLILPLVVLSLGGVMVVDVREGGDGGHRIWVPVPLALARIAATFAPAEARVVEVPELEPHLPLVIAVVDELMEQPDFTLVEVRSCDELVMIRKQGGRLVIEVRERGGDEVFCQLPLKTARKVLKACGDGDVRAAEVIGALQFMPSGQLVHVQSPDGEEVRIRML